MTALIFTDAKLNWRDGPSSLAARLLDCAQGDRQALAILYGALAAGVQRRLMRLLRNAALADDILQETFETVWRNAHRYDPTIGIPATWVWTIARNRAMNALQRQYRECRLDEVDGFAERPDLGPSPYDFTLRDEEAAVLHRCLEKLTPAARQCIQLAYFQGLSYSEVSARLGRPLGSVKTTFRSSLRCLRLCMARELAVKARPDRQQPIAAMAAAGALA